MKVIWVLSIIIVLSLLALVIYRQYLFLPTVSDDPIKTGIDGLDVEDSVVGSGAEAKKGDLVEVDYVGYLEGGQKFDSSYDRGQPFSFTIGAGQVIQGWDFGVLGMKEGGKRRLVISSDLGYGENGVPGLIPPNATLIFEVVLNKIN